MRRLLLSVFALGMMIGCGVGGGQDTWVKREGGVDRDAASNARAVAAGERLWVGSGVRMTVGVLASDVPGAFSWPDGRVYVTRGLVAITTEEELLAAVAHEAGHLLADHHVKGAVSLRGCEQAGDKEEAADEVGVRLLARCGVRAGVMGEMLRKVAASGRVPEGCKAGLRQRISILQRRKS